MKASTCFLPIWRCKLYFLVTCMCVKGVFSHSHATLRLQWQTNTSHMWSCSLAIGPTMGHIVNILFLMHMHVHTEPKKLLTNKQRCYMRLGYTRCVGVDWAYPKYGLGWVGMYSCFWVRMDLTHGFSSTGLAFDVRPTCRSSHNTLHKVADNKWVMTLSFEFLVPGCSSLTRPHI